MGYGNTLLGLSFAFRRKKKELTVDFLSMLMQASDVKGKNVGSGNRSNAFNAIEALGIKKAVTSDREGVKGLWKTFKGYSKFMSEDFLPSCCRNHNLRSSGWSQFLRTTSGHVDPVTRGRTLDNRTPKEHVRQPWTTASSSGTPCVNWDWYQSHCEQVSVQFGSICYRPGLRVSTCANQEIGWSVARSQVEWDWQEETYADKDKCSTFDRVDGSETRWHCVDLEFYRQKEVGTDESVEIHRRGGSH